MFILMLVCCLCILCAHVSFQFGDTKS